jgi:F-type H+-transporting ATPase subunit delta
MAKKMDEIMALADVYAGALLGAAEEQGLKEQVAREFAELIAYMDKDPAFEQFLIADTVDADARRESLEKLFRGRMSEILLNLLQVLNKRGRLDAVRMIYRNVELRMEAEHHQQEVVVETAMPLTEELRSLIQTRISKYMDKEALLIEKVMPDLLGGVVIHIGDVQIDASVSSRILELENRFGQRAVHEIHSGRGVEVISGT